MIQPEPGSRGPRVQDDGQTHELSQRQVAGTVDGLSAIPLGRIERGEVGPLRSEYWALINLYATHLPSDEQIQRLRRQNWSAAVERAQGDAEVDVGLAVRALRSLYGLSVEDLEHRSAPRRT